MQEQHAGALAHLLNMPLDTARLHQTAVLRMWPKVGLCLVVGPGHTGVEAVKHGGSDLRTAHAFDGVRHAL